MFRAKQLPTIIKDVVVTNNIYVIGKILHLKNTDNEYKFEHGLWFIKTENGKFINLGVGASPNYNLEERIEHESFNLFFEETEN